MAEVVHTTMSNDIIYQLQQIVGLEVVRLFVGRDLSFFIGFGELVSVKSVLGIASHGKWEFGTYRSAWRIVQGQKIVCAVRDIDDSIDDLRERAASLNLGRFKKIENLSNFDIRLSLDNDLYIDFMSAASDEDECLCIFCPEHIAISFSSLAGWTIGRSDKQL